MYALGVKYPNYIFHDCFVDKISLDGSQIIFFFNRGLYVFNGIDDYDYKKGKLVIECERSQQSFDGNISVYEFVRDKRKRIDIMKFISSLNKNGFKIYMDFYSDFGNALYVQGELNDIETELTITEIKNLSIVLD